MQMGLSTDRPLRVALVHASDLGGGAERSVVTLHRALQSAGHASTLFVGARRTDERGVVQIPYVRGLPGSRRLARFVERQLGWQAFYNPSFRALDAQLAGQFDVVHFNSLWGAGAYADITALPAITRQVPGVVTMRDEWLVTGHCAYFHGCERWRSGCGSCPDLGLAPAIERDGTASNWKRKRRALQASRLHVVAISEHLKRIAEASPLLAGKPVSRIYNGIDLNVFRPLPEEARQAARAALGFSPSDRLVLIAGQTVEGIRQGIATPLAVAALNRLGPMPDLRVIVVGHSAERVAKLLELPAVEIGFTKSTHDMATLFQIADVCLVTSEVEAFGRIGAESQACGTPVVSHAVGGIPEVVVDGCGGRVVAAGDVAALSAALAELLDDPALRREFGVRGRHYVSARFDQDQVAEQYLSLYRGIVSEAPENRAA